MQSLITWSFLSRHHEHLITITIGKASIRIAKCKASWIFNYVQLRSLIAITISRNKTFGWRSSLKARTFTKLSLRSARFYVAADSSTMAADQSKLLLVAPSKSCCPSCIHWCFAGFVTGTSFQGLKSLKKCHRSWWNTVSISCTRWSFSFSLRSFGATSTIGKSSTNACNCLTALTLYAR